MTIVPVSAAAGLDMQVQFNNAGLLGADSNFLWDNINKSLNLGISPAHVPAGFGPAQLTVGSNTDISMLSLFCANPDGDSAGINFLASQGAVASPTAVGFPSYYLGTIDYFGWNGSAYSHAAQMLVSTIGSGIVNGGVPCDMNHYVTDSDGNPIAFGFGIGTGGTGGFADNVFDIFDHAGKDLEISFGTPTSTGPIVFKTTGSIPADVGMKFITKGSGLFEISGAGGLQVDGNIGFFGTTPTTKGTVIGAKLPSDVVLASLLSILSGYGFVTDSST